MTADIDALKKKFREGRQAEAIAECDALCRLAPANLPLKQLCATMHLMVRDYSRSLELLREVRSHNPDNADVLFNIGMCQRELGDFQGAARDFKAYTDKFPGHPEGWACLAESRFKLNEFNDAIAVADRALQIDAASVPAWTVRGDCQKAIGQFENALASYSQAIRLAPGVAELVVRRGELCDSVGNMAQAVADYQAALALKPDDDATLKRATLCLLELNRGEEAIALCRQVLKAHPESQTAKLGAEWVLSRLVPLWHVPMMNETARNQPYYEALKSVVTPDKLVFEIGTGSGLLAMMAATLGARQVVTCEGVKLVAETAKAIVADNKLQDRVTVLAKPSYAVQVGAELPEKADVLVHEIFSSELLGEGVLQALEDAKARLVKPGADILPGTASIMIALVSGEELGKELHVDHAFGFDLRAFNAIHPKKRPLHREDLPRILLSDDVEAFRFDFRNQSVFPAEKKRIGVAVRQDGLCWGVIQWIRFEFVPGIFFENHPSHSRALASWQQTVYRFDTPLQLKQGAVVNLNAVHDRSRPWFELAVGE